MDQPKSPSDRKQGSSARANRATRKPKPTSGTARTCVLILGMHRSGTSALTRLVSMLGASLPRNILGAGPGNEAGHWEPERLMAFNDRILGELGLAWFDWGPLDWTRIGFRERTRIDDDWITLIDEDYAGRSPFVVKEPRLCRLAVPFLAALQKAGIAIVSMVAVRNPLDVIDSLMARSNWPTDHDRTDAALLWLSHMLGAEKAARDHPHAVVSYEAVMTDPVTALSRAARAAGWETPIDAEDAAVDMRAFVDTGLRHHARRPEEAFIDPQLAGWVADAYAALRDLEAGRAMPSARDTLDRIGRELAGAMPLLAAATRARRAAFAQERATRESLSGEIAARQAQIDGMAEQHGAEAQTLRAEIDALATRRDALEGELTSERGQSEQLAGVAGALRQERDALSAAIVEKEGVIAGLSDRLSGETEALRSEIHEMAARRKALEGELTAERENTQALSVRLEVAEAHFAQVAEEGESIRARFVQAQAEMEDLRSEILALTTQLEESNRLAGENGPLRETLAAAKARLAELEQTLENLQARHAAERSAIIAERDRAAAEAEGQAQTARAEAASAEAARLGSAEEVSRLCAELDRRIVELQEQSRSYAGQMSAKERESAHRLVEANRLSAMVEQLSVERDRLKNSLRDSTSEREKLAALIGERDARLAAETVRAREHEAAFESEAAKVRDFESKLASSEQETSQVRQQLGRAELEISNVHNAYRNSTSWKLTAPLRVLKSGPAALVRAIKISPTAFRLGGGIIPAIAKATRIFYKEGFYGLRKRVEFLFSLSQINKKIDHISAPQAVDLSIARLHPYLRFENKVSPKVSIIIPVYNNLNYTLECLGSLMRQKGSLTYEVIVMDDCSTDETAQVLSTIPGLRYIRNEENMGFLRNCNKAADLSIGHYLVMLNNDTVVLDGWLDRLHATFEEHDNVGIAGSKLVYPNGRLQEAGGIIWNDATGWNWGKLQDPNHPRYNYVRDVDYVSGASLMITKELFKAVGKFDERYIPAYAEDADLCMAVRDRGLRVVYQPHSVVIHFEGISHGTDENSGIKAYQRANKDKFEAKWRHTLHSQHYPSGQTPLRAADRSSQRHLLFIDHITPETDKDAGSVEVMHIIGIFQKLGYRVHFVPETNFANIPKYTPNIQSKGIEAIYGLYYRSVSEFLEEWGEIIDTVVIFRVDIAERNIAAVRRLAPKARVIFHPADLHYLRVQREAEMKNDDALKAEAEQLKKREISMVESSDMTYVVSEFEKKLLKEAIPSKKVTVIPMIRGTSHRVRNYDGRSGVAFVGGYRHTPNVDAVEYLINDIWPIVRAANVGARLKIIGSNMPDHFYSYAAPDIDIVGYVADIEEALGEVLMSVAPLRYGAGTKGKVGTSMNLGVPVIGNDVAFEGMPPKGLYDAVVLANSTRQLADEIIDLHVNPTRWEGLSQGCMRYVDEHFSVTKVREIVRDSLTFAQP